MVGVPSVHRIDLPCEATGFSTPPFDVQLKFLPGVGESQWTLLGTAAPGKVDALARWLLPQPGIESVAVAEGIAPKLLRAQVSALPAVWATMAQCVRVLHLDLAAHGHAAWFVEGPRDRLVTLVQQLQGARLRAVKNPGVGPRISRRQQEALSTAVALGYYEIPHRLDLRELAKRQGISLGALSELLRRAEAALLTDFIDSGLLAWPHVILQEVPRPGLVWCEPLPKPTAG